MGMPWQPSRGVATKGTGTSGGQSLRIRISCLVTPERNRARHACLAH